MTQNRISTELARKREHLHASTCLDFTRWDAENPAEQGLASRSTNQPNTDLNLSGRTISPHGRESRVFYLTRYVLLTMSHPAEEGKSELTSAFALGHFLVLFELHCFAGVPLSDGVLEPKFCLLCSAICRSSSSIASWIAASRLAFILRPLNQQMPSAMQSHAIY